MKITRPPEGRLKEVDPSAFGYLSGAELYNLAEGIGEQKNLAAAHPGYGFADSERNRQSQGGENSIGKFGRDLGAQESET